MQFRHSIVEAYNKYQEKCYQAALDLWNRIKDQENLSQHSIAREWRAIRARPQESEGLQMAWDSIFREGHDRPLKPRKKDFPKLPVTTTRHVPVGHCATIRFDFDNREVHWSVPENNHARDDAWRHPVAQAFARALRRVDWTRQSGGYFVGNDEYNKETGSLRGGGNYITQTFGPFGEDARQVVDHLS